MREVARVRREGNPVESKVDPTSAATGSWMINAAILERRLLRALRTA